MPTQNPKVMISSTVLAQIERDAGNPAAAVDAAAHAYQLTWCNGPAV